MALHVRIEKIRRTGFLRGDRYQHATLRPALRMTTRRAACWYLSSHPLTRPLPELDRTRTRTLARMLRTRVTSASTRVTSASMRVTSANAQMSRE